MSKWDKIVKRTILHDFPCTPEGCDVGAIIHFCTSEDTPDCEIEERCPLRPIYEEYLALRAVVEADLAGTTPRQAEIVCAVSIGLETDKTVLATLRRKRKAWEDLT